MAEVTVDQTSTSNTAAPAAGGGASVAAKVAARLLRLDRPTHRVDMTLAIPIPMRDGTILYADRLYPRDAGVRPTVLVRCPYKRIGLMRATAALPYAQRGFNVVMQSCRGTGGSEGHVGFQTEHDDGLDTIDWMRKQPWYDGQFAMVGSSYLGMVQWAIASDAGPELRAIAPTVAGSSLGFWHDDTLLLVEAALAWAWVMDVLDRTKIGPLGSILGMAAPKLLRSHKRTPLRAARTGLRGAGADAWKDLTASGGGATFGGFDFSDTVKDITAATHLIGGWYDVGLAAQLRDFERMRGAGRRPYLTVGPYNHASFGMHVLGVDEGTKWVKAHLGGDTSARRQKPVRLFVQGVNRWREFESWPPPSTAKRWYLQGAGALKPAVAADAPPDRYRYDPADPTPSLGGLGIVPSNPRPNNRKLESRSDVLVYTSAPLAQDLAVIGNVSAEIFFESNLEHTDLFVRLCEVSASGKSKNVTDGIVRLKPTEGPSSEGARRVVVTLTPTAYVFARGRRIRLQVSSGAFPRYARNLGTGEPIATGTAMRVAYQQVFHDLARPSAVVLPVCAEQRLTGRPELFDR